ncbi:MAG: phosphohydrolase [Chloroflexi bacterium]|nr:phosphohydrolase [Chloroflexota bacterium]
MLNTCPGSRAIKELRPEYIRCPHCQTEVEVWNDEFRARCRTCGAWVYRAQGATCLDWCKEAERCVGSAALAAYRRAREQSR